MKYKHVVLGGTFDHFHKGHESLIKSALKLSDNVTIGLATDELYKHKPYAQSIEPYEVRKSSVEDFVLKQNFVGSLDIIPIFDIFGTTLTDPTFEAMIVTKDTEENAERINEKRAEKGLSQMELIIVPFEVGDDGQKITSERIRAGQIDRRGYLYLSLFSKDLSLPKNLRDELRKPLGEVFEGEDKDLSIAANKVKEYLKQISSPLLITVGDISTSSLHEVDVNPNLAIKDNRSQRKDIPHETVGKVINTPGTISILSVQAINKYISDAINIKKNLTLEINGEEDLLALPAVLLAPLHGIVLYGQYEVGIIAVNITEAKKEQVKRILTSFTPS